jgi:hypothetical protein
MHEIAVRSILLRDQVELPDGLQFATKASCEGWFLVRTIDATQLEELIVSSGWTFARLGDRALRVGVGETVKDAVAGALRLALHRVANCLNAVEVEQIELTQYPWFHMARLGICTFRIQQSAVLPSADQFFITSTAPRQRRLPSRSNALFPQFASAMPQLKQMLISSRTAQARPR